VTEIAALGTALLLLSGDVATIREGKAADCLDLSRVTAPEVTRDGTILYRQNRTRSWRAEVIGRCPGLRWDARLAVFPFDGQRLCRSDRFQIFFPQSPIPGATCRFARFVPVDRPG